MTIRKSLLSQPTVHRLAVGGVALAAVLGLSSCTSTPAPQETATRVSFSDLVNATPAGTADTDELNWSIVREPFSLDPMTAQTQAEAPAIANLCEGLVRLDEDLQVAPALAERFEHVSPTLWRFHLRNGVTFWDGSPVTATDVVASLTRSFTDPLSYWTSYFTSVTAVRAVDDRTVEIDLSQPDNLFLQELTTAGGDISSAAALAAAGEDYGSAASGVMCTGPYQFTSWARGESITLTGNPDYWGGAPLTDTVTLRWIADETTLTQALSSGQIDGSFATPFSGITSLASSGAGTITYGNSSVQLMLLPTEKRGPLADAMIRQAIFYATDREAISSTIMSGAAIPGASFIPPYWSTDVDAWSSAYEALDADTNLDKAKTLVAASTFPDGATIDVAIPSSESYVKVANAMAQMLEQAGITMNVKVLTSAENDALFFDVALRSSYDGFLSEPFTNVPNPLEQMLYVTPGNVYNYGLYENAQFTELFDQARTESDPARALELQLQAAEILNEDLPWVPILVEPVRLWQKNGVSGTSASFSGFMYAPWALLLGATDN